MKHKVLLLAALLGAVLLCPAAAAEAEEGTVFLASERSGQVELIQCGSLSGPITAPGQMNLQDGESDALYQTIYQGLLEQKETITLTRRVSCTSSTLRPMLDAFANEVVEQYALVVNDNPRLFYATEGYSAPYQATGAYTDALFTVELKPTYRGTFTQDEIQAFNRQVDELVDLARAYDTPLEQALFLHDYLMTHIAYNWEVATHQPAPTENVYSAYGALVEGDAVCQGYALAYRLLLNELGIECITVPSEELNHMWNLVKIGNAWYHVDITWDEPTPNVEGGGRHANFLRSDEEITAQGHDKPWDSGGIRCDSDYQSDWWLNDVWFPIYQWEGGYYYIKTGGDPYEYRVYETESLLDAGTAMTSSNLANSYSSQNGVLWQDGQLYYTQDGSGDSRVLRRFDLATRQSAAVKEISFTAAASEDGKYDAHSDGVGLRLSPAGDAVQVYFNNRPGVLQASIPLRSYPVEWDRLSTNTAAVVQNQAGDTLQVGAVLPERIAGKDTAVLWVAFYDGATGRMTGLRALDLSGVQAGLNVWELEDCAGLGEGGSAVFLLDLAQNGLLPLCQAARRP